MMDVTYGETGEGKGVLAIKGELVIEHASQARDKLLSAINKVPNLEVNMEDVTEVDLSGLQLLCSAHRLSVLTGKRFALEGSLPGCLKNVVKESGFARHKSCAHGNAGCLWLRNWS